MCFTTIMQIVAKNDVTIPRSRKTKIQLFQKILNMNDSDKKTDLINAFCNAQKVFHTLTKCMRIKKPKQASNDHDLLYNELSSYKEHLKISINHNNTLYTFLLRDLHKLWKTALTTNENMIPTPIILKNPYDNIEFKPHTLYNIYFAMLFQGFHIDPIIHYFFKINFNLMNFLDENYVRLYEIALNDYTEQTITTNNNMYAFIRNIKLKYPHLTTNIYIPTKPIPHRVKTYCVDKMKTVLKYYCMLRFALDIDCLNSKINTYDHKFKTELSKINENIFCRPYMQREELDGSKITTEYYYFGDDNVIC